MNIGEYCPQQSILFHEFARDNIHNYYIDAWELPSFLG
jgi:hypothetical protein